MLKKKSVHCSWDIYREKLATKFSKVLWWAYWVGYLRNFHSFFVIIFFLNFNFFQLLENVLLKNKKNIPKKDAVQLKISSQCKRQKKYWKKEKEKRKMRKSQTKTINTFLFLLFYIVKLILWIWENLFYISTFSHLYYSFSAWQVIGNAVVKH